MKKNLFMVAAVALMAMVSCNKEEVNNGGEVSYEPSVVVEFTAGFDVETKTALDSEGKKTVWNDDDCISINDQKFVVSEIKEDGKAIFVNEAPLPADFAAPFTAIYPYGSDGKVPAKQTAVAGNFDPDAVIETATSDNYSLSFKNETSLLKFQVPSDFAETIKSVSVSSDNVLAGTDAKTVTITGSFEAGKDYYVAVLPGEATNFVVRINGYLSRNAEKVTINRSSIMNMKTLPAPVASGAYLKGSFNDWGDGQALYVDLNGWYVIKNFKITNNSTYFKFEKNGTWTGYNNTFYLNNYANTTKGSGDNVKINSGTYDFYFHQDENAIYVTTAGDYAPGVSRPVRLLVNNAGNKFSLKVYMWDSKGTPILGEWNSRPSMTKKITLNGTSYTYIELDSKYYGQLLNYKLTWNGGDSGDVKNVYFGQDNYYDLW